MADAAEDALGFPPGAFARLDETDDALFYEPTRLVQHIDDGIERGSEGLEIVPTLCHRHNATRAALVGDCRNLRRQASELRGRHAHPAKRIVLMRVEAGGDEDQQGPDTAARRCRFRRRDDLRLDPVPATAGRRIA